MKISTTAITVHAVPSFLKSHQNKHAFSYKFDSSETAIESLITSHSLYSKDDIFGFLSSERYVIYKDTQNLCESDRPDMLSGYADSIVKDMKKQQGILLHAGIGSTYEDLPNLRNSYLEALFLITNYDYLNADAAGVSNPKTIYLNFWPAEFPLVTGTAVFMFLSTPALLLETAIELSKITQIKKCILKSGTNDFDRMNPGIFLRSSAGWHCHSAEFRASSGYAENGGSGQ